MTKIEWCEETTGNRVVRSDGYVIVRCPSYPAAKPNGYVFEHRLVVARHLGRVLLPAEVVHHINGDRQDNRIENLELTTNSGHMAAHQADRPLAEKQARARRTIVPVAKRRRKVRRKIPCECGCGEAIETPDGKGRERKFAHGHNQRGRTWRWKGNGR